MNRISDLFKHPALREFADNVKNADLRERLRDTDWRELANRLRTADWRAIADRLKTADPLGIADPLANLSRPRNARGTAAIAAAAGLAVIGVSALGVAANVPASHPAYAKSSTHVAKTGKLAEAAKSGAAVKALHQGRTIASYFWDDASGRAGDTGMPAIGKPMQRGLAASPSWPLGTEGYVTYKGKTAKFFIGDRGPGKPSERGIMLDLDAKTFADLTQGDFDPITLMVKNNGGHGHIDITYKITKWGPGVGKKGAPVPFSHGAWND
ncbi:hypothetical protein Acor_57090 [Acrocarpospora corrugata]|uniref:Uncharacterized protein n=1 Tax=Acrocarpospora corrugata TaxID=35763 RepID=A0A5M3W8Z1_9ACTN|nr:hypothetical protein [Acrocarpospora corrugata]GES03643.1 hypothetical protein Acor_57090 [Acrocarpospora corrugata]